MALSGTIYKNVGSHWRLQLEWSATQNVANNTSTIKVNLYWMGLSSSATTYTSSTKSGSVTIDGTASAFSGAGLAKLTGAEKKLIKTYSKTVTHNSDGSKSVALSAYFDLNLSLGGTSYSRVSLSGTAVLNTIPRTSSLTSSPSWTAGNSLPITISRSTASFVHDVTIKVNGVTIKTLSNIATSTTVNFTVSENTSIFRELAKDTVNFNQATTIEVKTKSGSTVIGTNTYTGTCSSPNATYLRSEFDRYVYVDESVVFPLYRANSEFLHTIEVSFGSFTKTITGIDVATYTWTPSSTEQDQLYAQMPNESYKNGVVSLTTYYNGVKVRNTLTAWIQFYVRNSQPIFNDSQVGYADTNSTTIALTGNDQYIIQGQSDVRVSIDSVATGVNSATISRYEITLGNVTKSLTGTGFVSFGKVTANVNIPIKVSVIDSRGFTTVVTKTITVLPYTTPLTNLEAKRLNNFESETTIKLKGSFSPLTIGGINKNTVVSAQYRYREKTGSWGSYESFELSVTGSSYAVANVSLDLDNTNAYEIEVKVTDLISGSTTTKMVDVGQPIFFIDSTKKSIGVNKFPSGTKTFEISGGLDVGGSLNVAGSLSVNSDISTTGVVNTDALVLSYGARITQKNSNFVHVRTPDDSEYFNLAVDQLYLGTGFQGRGRVTSKDINAVGWHGFSGTGWAQMQKKELTVSTGNAVQAYADFTWDKAFGTVCQAVQATPIDANSASYHVAVYSVTRTGARVYISNIHKETFNLNIKVQVLGIGD